LVTGAVDNLGAAGSSRDISQIKIFTNGIDFFPETNIRFYQEWLIKIKPPAYIVIIRVCIDIAVHVNLHFWISGMGIVSELPDVVWTRFVQEVGAFTSDSKSTGSPAFG